MSEFYTATDHFVLLPAILLAVFGFAALLVPKGKLLNGLPLLLAGEAFVGYMLMQQWDAIQATRGPIIGFKGAMIVDGLGIFFNAIFVLAAAITALISYRYFAIEDEEEVEYYGLLLLAQAGMYFLATGTDLVTLFVGLETMSVTFYILVGFLRREKRSNEAALKYLLLGAFAAGFLAYGFSLLYGLTGSTRFEAIGRALESTDGSGFLLILAILLTVVGLLFKLGAAPFHMWTPDAYEGAPTPVTAYLSVASKAAALVFMIRLLLGPLGAYREVWQPAIVLAAVISLTIGNFAAITQSNVKRMLAYSSIAHVGYILLGLVAGNERGYHGALIYTAVYAFMTLGAFLVLVVLRREGLPGEHLDDLAGLMKKSPLYAVLMVIFLLSLAGIPPTAGFIGKYYIFMALVSAHSYFLAIIGALYIAVSLFYYFRIVRAMFVEDLRHDAPLASSLGVRVSLGVTAVATVLLGIFPEPLIQWVRSC